MLKVFAVILLTCGVVAAQNSNSSTTTERQRKTNTNRAETAPAPTPAPAPKKAPASTAQEPGSEGVLAAFNTLLDGIRHASVEEVMSSYWNNPRLSLFNYNGSVTKGWEQVRRIVKARIPRSKT